MRNTILLSMAFSVFLLFCGCEYSVPAGKPGIPLDMSLAGIWEKLPGPEEKNGEKTRILVLKYSDTEYLVVYSNDADALYFRAYPVKIGDISAVQIQWIGTNKGPLEEKDRKYHLVSANVKGDELEIKILNNSLVPKTAASQAEFESRILQNKNNPELFRDPGLFKKVKK